MRNTNTPQGIPCNQYPQNNQYMPYNPYIKPKKAYKPLSKKDIVFMALFFISAFLVVCLGLWGKFHLGFTVAYFVLFAVTSLYIFKKANIFSIVCGVFSLAGAITFTLFNDHFINFIMLLLIAGLYSIYCIGISDAFNSDQGSFRILFDILKSATTHVFGAFPNVFGGMKATASGKKRSYGWLIGILVAAPVLIVIIPLLASSDAAFEGLLISISKNFGTALLQIIIALILTPYIFAFAFEKRNGLNKKAKTPANKPMSVSSSACVSFLAVISVVYIVYLFSQLAYFFSAFEGILPNGYEYSASVFARRGFFEMFIICVINISVTSVSLMLADKKNLGIKLLSCFISLFSVLMAAVALQKMRLNVSIYGLSKNRVMVTAFMLMLLITILFFILHIFVPKIKYMQPIIIICSAVFLTLSFCDMDSRIAQYNINAYQNGKIEEIDMISMSRLSDSAIPSLVELTNSDDKQISKEAAYRVARFYKKNHNEKDIRKFNFAHEKAVKSIKNTDSKLLGNVMEITQSADWFRYDDDYDKYIVYFDNRNRTEVYIYNEALGVYVHQNSVQDNIQDNVLY